MEKTLTTRAHAALIAMVKSKREAANLTQETVASILGEHQSFIARLESGQRRVDVIEFLELARVIGFDPVEELRILMNNHQFELHEASSLK